MTAESRLWVPIGLGIVQSFSLQTRFASPAPVPSEMNPEKGPFAAALDGRE